MTTHVSAVQRQRLIWRLLDKLDSLSFIARLKWLRALRGLLIIAIAGCLAQHWLFYALLGLIAWGNVEQIITRVTTIEMLREISG